MRVCRHDMGKSLLDQRKRVAAHDPPAMTEQRSPVDLDHTAHAYPFLYPAQLASFPKITLRMRDQWPQAHHDELIQPLFYRCCSA